MGSIDLYAAVERMKQISLENGTFQIKFRKYNRQRQSGGDLVTVKAARVRKKTSDEEIRDSSYKLFFVDAETGRALNCWQILITEFNGLKTVV